MTRASQVRAQSLDDLGGWFYRRSRLSPQDRPKGSKSWLSPGPMGAVLLRRTQQLGGPKAGATLPHVFAHVDVHHTHTHTPLLI